VTALTAADYEHRRTWALTIAAELLRKDGAAAPFRDEGKERCGAGGFRFCRQSSTWYSFATDRGGLSATSLIRFLQPDYTREDASAWLASFSARTPASDSSKPRTKSGPRGAARPSQRFAGTVSTPGRKCYRRAVLERPTEPPAGSPKRSRANALGRQSAARRRRADDAVDRLPRHHRGRWRPTSTRSAARASPCQTAGVSTSNPLLVL
jgi:hypothetical protein